jgi:membrane protease YdiL (CAAX protease family)
MLQSIDSTLKENRSLKKPITKRSYLIGLFIIFASSYSQYIFGGFGPILGIFIVYGVPVLAVSLLCELAIIRRALNNTSTALKFGLGSFGAFTVLGIVAATAIFFIIVKFDPTAVNLLNKPNPVLNIPPKLAWTMIWVSLLVVGPVEEYLFRGFMYGGLLNLFKGRHWLSLAFISSILFAALHLYYALVYGIVSLVQFTDLVTFGMAMATTYYLSGGNLLVPAVIHGAYDATGFIGVATSLDTGILLRGVMILISVIVAIALLVQKMLKKKDITSIEHTPVF